MNDEKENIDVSKSKREKRSSKKLIAIVVGVVVIVIAGAVGGIVLTGSHPTSKKAVSAPKVLYVAGISGITTWDPSYSYSTEAEYLANIYEPLIWANPPGSSSPYRGGLAKTWKVSPNGLTWTFYLRHNVTFHNGAPLTAQDVIFSLQRTVKIFYTVGQGAGYMWWAAVNNWTTYHLNITAPNKYTVVFHLTTAVPLARIAAAIYSAWIYSSKLPKGVSENSLHAWFDQGHDLGSGPYELAKYVPGKELILKAYPNYWGGWNNTQYKEIYINLAASKSSTQTQMLESGEIDIAQAPQLTAIPQLQKNPKISVYISPSEFNYIGYINIWAYHPELAKEGLNPYPFTHKLVRQAISYGINYKEVLRAGVLNYGRQSKGPVPYGLWPHIPAVDSLLKQYTYNLKKARDLLAEAGYPNTTTNGKPMAADGSNAWMILRLNYTAENAVEAAFAPVIQQSLAKLGIYVKINALSWKAQWSLAKQIPAKYEKYSLAQIENNETLLKKIFGPKQDIFLILWWPSMADGFDNLFSMFHAEWPPVFNLCYWYNTTYDNLIWEAYTKTSTNPTLALHLYVKAMNFLIEQAPALFLIDVDNVYAMNSHIGGYTPDLYYPTTIFFYELYYK